MKGTNILTYVRTIWYVAPYAAPYVAPPNPKDLGVLSKKQVCNIAYKFVCIEIIG